MTAEPTGADDELAWPPPQGPGDPPEPDRPPARPGPERPDPRSEGPTRAEPPAPWPPTPPPPEYSLARARASGGLFDRSGAALAALGFGLVAGIGLPPLIYWLGLSILLAIGVSDPVAAFGPLVPAFAVPITLLASVEGMLRRSAPRYDSARVTVAVTGAVTLGLWLVVAILGGLVLLLLSSIG